MIACKDCAHYFEPWASACDHPLLTIDDPVHGKVAAFPFTERKVGGRCGPEAKHFRARTKHAGFFARLFRIGAQS